MERLRVAYLIDSLGAGGSERSLMDMLPHLETAGVEPRIFVLTEPGDRPGFGREARRRALSVEPLPGTAWPRRALLLRRRLVDWQADILHTTLFRSDQLGRVAAARTGIPVLGSLVNLGYEPARFADPRIRRWRLSTVRLVDGWTARHLADHFHAVSQAVKDSAVERLGLDPESITVVHRGRDLERLGAPGAARRTAARARRGIADDELLVVSVGRHAYQKGQLVLLEALRPALRAGQPIRLVIAGAPGPCSAELRAYVEEHRLTRRVELPGHVDDVPELLAAADVFAFPSRFEGLPGAVLEAMAMALPVVASDIAPLRELFAEEGDALLVPPDSPDELGVAIEALAGDPALRRRLGARGREIFVDRFDVRRTAPAMVDLYRRVVGGAS